MKKRRLFLTLLLVGLTFSLNGCKKFHDDWDAPSPPTNIRTITGDNRVDIYWDESRESDVAGYNVYYSYTYNGEYKIIGSSENDYFIDEGAQNGETYYYAVTAYDFDGNESDLSTDVAYDTPRPEGFNQAVFDLNVSPGNAGYDFSKYLVLSYNDKMTDFFFEKFENKFYVNVWEDSDVQDMGSTKDIWDISEAPLNGWVNMKPNDNIKYSEAVAGHTYVIWTWDNHYAKVRIKSISGNRMVFDWAYQLLEGNRELKRNVITDRKAIPDKIERH